MSRYGIDWSKGLENFTDEDYDQIFAETTKIIEGKDTGANLAGAYYDRGIIYDERGDYEKAATDYTSAIQLNCQFIDAAYYNRGKAYYEMNHYDDALRDYNVYLQYQPNDEKVKKIVEWITENK